MYSQFKAIKCFGCEKIYSLVRLLEEPDCGYKSGHNNCDIYPAGIPLSIFDGEQDCPEYKKANRKPLSDFLYPKE